METIEESTPKGLLAGLPPIVQWLFLAAVTALLAGVMESLAVPAALLIGPMLAAVLAGVLGAGVRVVEPAFGASQSVIGVLIAGSVEPAILLSFLADWPLYTAVVLATLAASSFLGWLVSRWNVLPGTTGVWGAAPGAASAMVLMAGAFGADVRLVAFMQYLRVILVTLASAAIARLWVDTSGVEAPATVWFPSIEPAAFTATIVFALGGAGIGRLLRLPTPYLLGALLTGAIAHLGFGVDFQIPEWLLAATYVFIGWTIGLKFDRAILATAARALPQVLASILALMAFCGGLAWLLHREWGVDPLTAYLATSPGGMDSVAIIAAASQNVNISFIMALQMARFVLVLALGPPISRFVARRLGG